MTDGGAFFFNNSFIRNGIDLTDRSDFYIPFVAEPGATRTSSSSARSASTGPTTRRRRTPATSSGRRSATISRPAAPARRRTARATARSPRSASAAARRSTSARSTASSTSARTPRSATTRPGRRPRTTTSRTAGGRLRGRSEQLPDRLRRLQRVQRGDPRASRATSSARWTAARSWTDVSGNLPDTPVNSIVLDPSYPNTLYVGTDVGAFVSYNGGTDWSALGTGFPLVAVDQLDLDASNRLLAAGTHGRGAFRMFDTPAAPALVLSKVDDDRPVGPSSHITYTLTLEERGQRSGDRRDDHRSRARQHELRLGRRRRHERRRVWSRGRCRRSRRAQASRCTSPSHIANSAQEEGRRRS